MIKREENSILIDIFAGGELLSVVGFGVCLTLHLLGVIESLFWTFFPLWVFTAAFAAFLLLGIIVATILGVVTLIIYDRDN